MSSPLGHSIAVLTIFALDKNRPQRSRSRGWWLWAGWLVVLGTIPDLDYLFPVLRVSTPDGYLRGTHSLAFVLALPVLTALALLFTRQGRARWLIYAVQAVTAGLSHLLLDFLVASRPLPLLYPFSSRGFSQPLHLLPSAGELTLGYLPTFQNLMLEIGILAPISVVILAAAYRLRFGSRTVIINLLLWVAFIGMCIAGFRLSR